MKTTIELPDALFRRAKATAATRGVSLKRFFSEAVEKHLRGEATPEVPPWRKLAGELSALRGETRRIGRLIEEEFEQIEAEDDA